jgi:hypothetical protein
MRFSSRDACRRLGALRRRARAFLLQWIAAGAAIDEAHHVSPLDERELAALSEAIDQARQAGR